MKTEINERCWHDTLSTWIHYRTGKAPSMSVEYHMWIGVNSGNSWLEFTEEWWATILHILCCFVQWKTWQLMNWCVSHLSILVSTI
jgi:hypothetical protein